MNFEWIANPITFYALLAAGLATCLYLFVSTKLEVRSAGRHAENSMASLQHEVQKLAFELHEIRDNAPDPPPVALPLNSGLNLTKRAQAVRMHHRGESLSTIAAALQAPRNEIELLLKVQQLLNETKQ